MYLVLDMWWPQVILFLLSFYSPTFLGKYKNKFPTAQGMDFVVDQHAYIF